MFAKHLTNNPIVFLSSFIPAFLVFTIFVSYAIEDIVIIANKDVMQDTLTQEDIVNAFLGKKTKWDNQIPLTVVLNRSEDAHLILLKKYIRRTPSQFKNVWRRLVFTGEGKYPISYPNSSQVVQHVAKKSGAISYVSIGDVTDEVKIIDIR